MKYVIKIKENDLSVAVCLPSDLKKKFQHKNTKI